MLLLLVLAVPPPPSSAYVQIKNQGASQGYARIINCSGSGVTCAVNTTTAEATLTVTTSDAGSGGGSWDGGPAIPACSAGYVLDADGGVLYCINTIANATLAATATALASNPTDCSSGQYANAIAASGNLTCAQVAASQLSGQLSDAQLDGGYSGVGACSAHQWASTLTRNASPTCTQPAYSDLSGTPLAGGSVPQVQYNADGGLGGITNVTSDGTRFNITSESTHPASPSAGALHYGWAAETLFPQIPFVRDAYTGSAIPQGVLDVFGEGASGSNWVWQCARMPGYSVTPIGLNGPIPTASSWASFGSWSNSGLINRIFWVQGTPGVNAAISMLQGTATAWLGNTTGAGGFIFWNRVALHVAPAHTRWMFGLQSSSSAFTNVEPSSLSNTAYFGCDNGASPDSNIHVCSNDNSGSATCTDLGSSFPCRTADAIYDFWLTAAPQAALPDGGTGISYYVERLDSSHTVNGIIASDLPQNTVQLRWLDEAQTADAGAPFPTGFFHAACIASNM